MFGIAKLHVVGTGGDAFEQEREQWDDGNNVVALEPVSSLVMIAMSIPTRFCARLVSKSLPSAERNLDADVAEATA